MDLLSSCYLFDGLSYLQIENLARIGNETSVEKGAWLFHEGDAAERFYILVDGSIDLLTTIENDVELPTARLRNSGDCFGTGSLVAPYQYSLSARCTEAADLLTLSRDGLAGIMERDSGFGRVVMENLAAHYLDRLKEARQELKIHFKILLKVMRF